MKIMSNAIKIEKHFERHLNVNIFEYLQVIYICPTTENINHVQGNISRYSVGNS